MDNKVSQVLHHTQRLRYEALSNFATELNKCENYVRLAQALVSHTKFIVDFYTLRIHYQYDSFSKGFEVLRGEGRIFEPCEEPLYPFEQVLLTKSLPIHYTAAQVKGDAMLSNSAFNNEKIIAVYFLPVSHLSEQKILISVGIKSYTPALDVDFKFLKLIADLVANKLYQLALLERIERKSQQLEQRNKQINQLNRDLEEMVNRRTLELTEANSELSTLFYRTSHDFRAPLANILGLANLGKLVTDDHDVLNLFDQCEVVVQRLDSMLKKLTALSIQHTSNLSHPVDFANAIARVKEKLADRVADVDAQMDVDVRLKQVYIGNPDFLLVIFENLLENSLTYHKGKPRIKIVVFQHKQDVVIKFSDNGQGIPANVLSRVFEMYYRGNVNSQGSGLGLYVVRKLVKMLGGEIFAHSKHQHYTHFILRLPLNHSENHDNSAVHALGAPQEL